jgi:hypothetical protein
MYTIYSIHDSKIAQKYLLISVQSLGHDKES